MITFPCPRCQTSVESEDRPRSGWVLCPSCDVLVRSPVANEAVTAPPPPLPVRQKPIRSGFGKRAHEVYRSLCPDGRCGVRVLGVGMGLCLLAGLLVGGFVVWVYYRVDLTTGKQVEYVDRPKYTRTEFRQAVTGKTPDEVVSLLGRPDSTEDERGWIKAMRYDKLLAWDPVSKTVDRAVILHLRPPIEPRNNYVVYDVTFRP